MNFKFKILIISFFSLVLFFIDRVLKYIFSATNGEYFIFGDILKLKTAFNCGIAFGIPVNYQLFFYLYIIIFFSLVWLLVKEYKNKNITLSMAFIFVIIGSFSNFLDRVFNGQVVDYIDLKYYSVFNIADIMIVVGVIIILFNVLRLKNETMLKLN